jgi:PAS domain-containing protein
MVAAIPKVSSDRRQLQQIIAGLTEGVILIEPDQSILWANRAALAMHGVEDVAQIGATVDEYRARFQLRYRNNRKLGKGHTPIERVVAGETFRDVTVEVTPLGKAEPEWTHQVRSLVLSNEAGDPDCLVLIMHDVTEPLSLPLTSIRRQL